MKICFLLVYLFSSAVFAQISISPLRQPLFTGDVKSFYYAANKLFCTGRALSDKSFFASSSDAGKTWNVVTEPFASADNLASVFFIDENTGWLGGNKGIIYKTTNGGAAWFKQTDTLVYKGAIYDIHFSNPLQGYFCGTNSSGSAIFKTENGGSDWEKVPNPYMDSTTITLFKMSWKDNLNCTAVGAIRRFMTTTDGGKSWINGQMPGTGTTQYDIVRTDANTLFAAGSSGKIFKSTDNGTSFTISSLPVSSTFYSLETGNPDELFAFGQNGLAFKSTDGGTEWIQIPQFSPETFNASIRIGGKILLGSNYSGIFSSDDLGKTWKSNNQSNRNFYRVFAESEQSIVAAGGADTTSRSGEIEATNNGGQNWMRAPVYVSNAFFDIVKFGSYIYACGGNGLFYVSTDNGSSWQNYGVNGSTAKLNSMSFLNSDNGYIASADGRIYKTSNKGVSWSSIASFPGTVLFDISMLSGTKGFAVGSGDRILQTTDGISFSHGSLAKPREIIKGISMQSELKGYICGENGSVYRTDDGFKNISILTDTTALRGLLIYDVLALNDTSVWAVGEDGTILSLTSPGKMTLIDAPGFKNDFTSVSRANDSTLIISGFNGVILKLRISRGKTSGIERDQLPASCKLDQNYPNPFNPSTKIVYTITKAGMVDLRVYDMLGREVTALVNEIQPAGRHEATFNGQGLPSGIYIYKIKAGLFSETRKMMLVK